jgi:capsular polysaccharide biosynthesis protein
VSGISALEQLGLVEQIALFQTVDVVIGQYGAALANVVWMRRGSHVFEFILMPQQEHANGDVSAICGLHHFLLQRDFKEPVDVREAAMRVSAVVGLPSWGVGLKECSEA